MPNVCLEDSGAEVVLATSWDPAHAPESIVDGKAETFWSSTGTFPQEIVISFPVATRITSLETRTAGVRQMVIQKSANQTASGWDDIRIADLPEASGVQMEDHTIDPCIVRHVRLLLKSGHGNFVAVYSISAEGTPIEEQYTRGRG